MTEDNYWSDAQRFLQQRIKPGETLMAPVRLKKEFMPLFPYSFSHSSDVNFFDWMLIHKGMVEKFHRPFLLSAIATFQPVFANEVFVILAKQEQGISANPKHLKPFLDQLHPAAEGDRSWFKSIKDFLFPSNLSQQLDLILKRLVSLEAQVKQLEKTGQSRSRISSSRMFAALSKETFTQLCRSACQTAYLGNDTILCRVLGRYLLYADSQDVGIVPHLSMNGYWETWMTLAVARVLQPGWHCVDVGANHGYYTLLMGGIVGKKGRVVAIEPNPRLANLVKRTIAVNGFQDQVMVLTEAVSETAGETLKLVIPHGLGMNASLVRNAIASDEIVEVTTTTLDQLTASWETVDFLKIDAEGAEEMIWRGMQETIRKHPHLTIVLEFNDARSPDPKAFLSLIQQAGFRLQHIDFDSEIKEISLEQCLRDRPGEDWLLFLRK
jgi:FkbM family methyltransferase